MTMKSFSPAVSRASTMLVLLLALLGSSFKSVAEGTVLVHENFNTNDGGFTFHKDAFGTHNPHYVKGERRHRRLGIWLGIKDHPTGGMSGGWKRRVHIPRDAQNVWISFDYHVTLSAAMDEHEFVKVLAKFAGRSLGPGGVVFKFDADNRHVVQRTGWKHVQFDLGHFRRGDYELLIGAFLNRKTEPSERADVLFDNVKVKVEFKPSQITKYRFTNGSDGFWFTPYSHYAKGHPYHGTLGVWLGGMNDHPAHNISGDWGRWVYIPHGTKYVKYTFEYTVTLSAGLSNGQFVEMSHHIMNGPSLGGSSKAYANNGNYAQTSRGSRSSGYSNPTEGWHLYFIRSLLNDKKDSHDQADILLDNVCVEIHT